MCRALSNTNQFLWPESSKCFRLQLQNLVRIAKIQVRNKFLLYPRQQSQRKLHVIVKKLNVLNFIVIALDSIKFVMGVIVLDAIILRSFKRKGIILCSHLWIEILKLSNLKLMKNIMPKGAIARNLTVWKNIANVIKRGFNVGSIVSVKIVKMENVTKTSIKIIITIPWWKIKSQKFKRFANKSEKIHNSVLFNAIYIEFYFQIILLILNQYIMLILKWIFFCQTWR